MKSKARKLLALLGLASFAATACCASSVTFVDTITGASNYQIGSDCSRGLEVGFESYPGSGNFTSIRPSFEVDSAGKLLPVCDGGTSGVPIVTAVGAWVAQPFTPAQGGSITSVSFIAQNKHSVALGYETEVADASRTLTAFIVPADSAGNCTVTSVPATSFSIPYGSAGVGAIVSSTNSASVTVTAGQEYFLVVGVGTPTQSWSGDGQYARLNWEAIGQVINRAANNVGVAEQNFDNASGQFFAVPGVVIGFKLTGATAYNASSIGDAKNQPENTPVSINNLVVTAKTGGIGPNFFYMEDANRASGIRVKTSQSVPAVGQYVSVSGTVNTENHEKVINASSVTAGSTTTPVGPLFTTLKSLSGTGLSAVGLLVRVAGTVQSISPVVINDGSVNVTVINAPAANVGDMLAVTGIASVDASGNPVILVP